MVLKVVFIIIGVIALIYSVVELIKTIIGADDVDIYF